MKKFLIVMLVLGLFICMIGAAFATKKYEGETMQVYLTIQTKRERIMEYIAPKLEEKYGIKLTAENAGSNTQVQKLIVMKDNPLVSVVMLEVPAAIKANDMGLLEAIDLQKVPNSKDLYDWAIYKDKEGKVIVLASRLEAIGLLYNDAEFKRNKWDPPTSWEDLWRKELSGLVSITAPEATYGLSVLVTFARLGGGGEDNIQPGLDKIKSLLPNMHTIHTWSSELVKLFQLNEVVLGTTGCNVATRMAAEGFPVKWVAPKELSSMHFGGISIVKNGPFQDVAHDFINLYYSKEFQLIEVQESGITSTHKNVWRGLSETEKGKLPINPEDFSKFTVLDWAKINENRADWTEEFHKVVSK